MPYVRSYYRRSQGAASVDAPAGARLPSVAVYDAATGSDLLKTRAARVTGVSFSTGLPGGFLECNFTVRASGARAFGIDTGQKVVVSRGLRVVWWGWVEDVQRVQRGRLIELAVSCLGPWQTLEQRLIDVDYDDWYGGDEAIKAMLASVGTYISSDYSKIESTGVNIADLEKDNMEGSELVKLVCKSGNASDQPMLFAIWEPKSKPDIVGANNLIPNPTMELGSGTSAEGWDTAWLRLTDRSVSLSHSLQATVLNNVPFAGIDSDANLPCSANTVYRVSLWVYAASATSLTGTITLGWYDDVGLLDDVSISLAVTTGQWTQTIGHVTSDALCDSVSIKISFENNSDADTVVAVDDVYLSLAGTSMTPDDLPRAELWARDLSEYDYVLWTGALVAGLAITETTRDLVNAVKASYGSSSYTSLTEDGTSQTAYRRRDAVVTAGSDTGQTAAEAIRDAYLATYKDPRQEPASFSLAKPGAIRTVQGSVVPLETVRAGDRLMIADGPLAGSVIMVASTRYANGALSITPEGATAASSLLARSITR